MPTFNQLNREARKNLKKYRKNSVKFPCQFRGVCTNVMIQKPKKPNSAQRKVCKVKLCNTNFRVHKYGQKFNIKMTNDSLIAKIPGEGHNLRQHSVVVLRARNSKDLPGVSFEVIRGVLDASGVSARRRGRSRYGAKKPEEKAKAKK